MQTLSDITKLTPGLRFDNASAFFQPTIRGVVTPVTTSGGGTNAGIYADGFYSPNPLEFTVSMTEGHGLRIDPARARPMIHAISEHKREGIAA